MQEDQLSDFPFARISRTLDEYGTLLDKAYYLHQHFYNSKRQYSGAEVAQIIREDLMDVPSLKKVTTLKAVN